MLALKSATKVAGFVPAWTDATRIEAIEDKAMDFRILRKGHDTDKVEIGRGSGRCNVEDKVKASRAIVFRAFD